MRCTCSTGTPECRLRATAASGIRSMIGTSCRMSVDARRARNAYRTARPAAAMSQKPVSQSMMTKSTRELIQISCSNSGAACLGHSTEIAAQRRHFGRRPRRGREHPGDFPLPPRLVRSRGPDRCQYRRRRRRSWWQIEQPVSGPSSSLGVSKQRPDPAIATATHRTSLLSKPHLLLTTLTRMHVNPHGRRWSLEINNSQVKRPVVSSCGSVGIVPSGQRVRGSIPDGRTTIGAAGNVRGLTANRHGHRAGLSRRSAEYVPGVWLDGAQPQSCWSSQGP